MDETGPGGGEGRIANDVYGLKIPSSLIFLSTLFNWSTHAKTHLI